MKKRLFIIFVVLLLVCVAWFKVTSMIEKLNAAQQAAEAVAMETLGEDCQLITKGPYYGPPPYKNGFWFGFVDQRGSYAIAYAAVPTLDGKDWYVREIISNEGGDGRKFLMQVPDLI